MVSQTASAAHIAARVIPAIGGDDFPDRLLSVYRDLAECDLCSAFLWKPHDGPKLLFAIGMHSQLPGFALSASHAYAQKYWRLDAIARHSRTLGRSLSLQRMTAADVHDSNYRRDCYQRGGIAERLTLFDTQSTVVSVSGYRTVARGGTTSEAMQRMGDAAPILIAALHRHNELIERSAQTVLAPSRGALLQWAGEHGLSSREAEVAAGLAMGLGQSDIARSTGLAVNSIITYRRRAYQKLGVADRRELRTLCEQALALKHLPAAT